MILLKYLKIYRSKNNFVGSSVIWDAQTGC